MIKAFRRIRQKLLTQNKFTKYLLYAIGEIILVVVGILIALSINNQNEERKSTQKGEEILADIRENVEFNNMQFQKDIDVNRKAMNSIDIVLDNITIVKTYNDSIARHLRFATWWASSRWKSSGYEALVGHGVDIIQSEKLRKSIINLYEISYPEIAENTRLSEGNWHTILPFWLELINRDRNDYTAADQHEARPFDYQKIVESNMFESILTFNRSQRVLDIQLRNNCMEKNREIIDLINKELSK